MPERRHVVLTHHLLILFTSLTVYIIKLRLSISVIKEEETREKRGDEYW